jgi:hypothetical protein
VHDEQLGPLVGSQLRRRLEGAPGRRAVVDGNQDALEHDDLL